VNEIKIDKAISHLRDYETKTKDKYFNEKRKFQHREGGLNLDECILKFLDLFEFEPMKKYVEELEDEFEPDSTSISNSSTEEK
jgi:hypothetical protein